LQIQINCKEMASKYKAGSKIFAIAGEKPSPYILNKEK
jgi:hypothetical protein